MLTLTEKAAAKIRAQQEYNAQDFLRVGVRAGGCSGFTYELLWETQVGVDDIRSLQRGINLLVDPQSLPLLEGAILDYKEGLMNSGYVFTNPNSSRSCGCGKSFS